MDRSIYNQLLAWKNREGRKPLILNGARQVGKTYVLQQFGKNEYQKLAFFSLDRNAKAVEVFEKGGSTADMLMALSAISQTHHPQRHPRGARRDSGLPEGTRSPEVFL